MKTTCSIAKRLNAAKATNSPGNTCPIRQCPAHLFEAWTRRGLLGAVLALLAAISLNTARAVDFTVSTGQDLQNALTAAANNGADNTIYITAGYYIGNFNYNSSGNNNLTISNALGVTPAQIIFDGASLGRDLNITNSGTGDITVAGITFLRNCGSAAIVGALRIGAGSAASVLVNGCQFLPGTNTVSIGLELVSGLNATVTNCAALGSPSYGGAGISISVSGNATVQNCLVTTNSGYGLSISGGGIVSVTNSIFTGNGGGANCSGASVALTGNNFTGNANRAAYCYGTTVVTLTGNTFIENDGGGAVVFCPSGSVIIGNTFTGNSAINGGGGGIDVETGGATITNNIFVGNTAGVGGGASISGYRATSDSLVAGNIFTGNSVAANVNSPTWGLGGALSITASGLVTGNKFNGNSGSYGGAINAEGPSSGSYGQVFNGQAPTISGNTIEQNSATASGGGIFAVSAGAITISDNLVAQNISSSGGGVWADVTNLFLINNTITANNSAGIGGGVTFQVDGLVEQLNIFNNIIFGNTATGSGRDVYLSGTGQKKLFEFNDVDDVNSMYGIWDLTANNIYLSPQFFDPVNGDYHTTNTSPCIAAATISAPALPATDLDGTPRIVNGLVDMGCYQFTTTVPHPADVNGDFALTAAEFTAYTAAWKAGLPWVNGPNPISANYVTRAGYLMTNNVGAYHNDGSARPVNWKTGAQ